MDNSKTISATLRVEGLHCADCAARLEKAVSRLEGVSSVTVGYGTGSLKVEYDPKALALHDVASLADRLGYTLTGHPGVAHRHEHAEHDHGQHEGHDHTQHDHEEHEHEHKDRHGHVRGASFVPVATGAVAMVAGFILGRVGVAWYWAAYLAGAVVAGFPVAKAGIAALFAGGGADINLLTTVAGIGAMFLGEWAEAAAVLTLFSVGEYLEERASEKARSSIRELMDLAPRSEERRGRERV